MPEAGEYFQVAQRFETAVSGDMMNIYVWKVLTGTCTDGELMTAMASLLTTAYGRIVSQIHQTVSIQEGTVSKLLWSGTEWYVLRYVGTIYPTMTATNASQALPHATSALVQFPTTKPRVVGKKFLPVFGEDQQDASAIGGTALTNMLLYANDIRTTVLSPGSATAQYTVLLKDGTDRPPYSHVASGTISSQKRRKPGVGS